MLFARSEIVSKTISQLNEWGKNKVPFLLIADFEMHKPLCFRLDQVPKGILFEINGLRNFSLSHQAISDIDWQKYPMPFEQYRLAFELVQAQITHGNSFLLNLTFPTPIRCNLSLKEVFLGSKAPYKGYFKAFGEEFTFFSPEIFVRIRNGKISSFPMKGTIDAQIPNAEQLILNNPKELAEHATIVDLIRNDLSMVAENVSVKRFRYTDRIRTNQKELLQVSSEIEGDLPPDYCERIGEIMACLLPAGSVSGAPKRKTIEIIRQAEGQDRGFYTGIIAVFDGKNLDSGVMIRFIENRNGHYFFRSGGGITAQSELRSEYQEMIDKVYLALA
jgi:para-aminobenzoate synthetase component I